jgi:hypothetical protein
MIFFTNSLFAGLKKPQKPINILYAPEVDLINLKIRKRFPVLQIFLIISTFISAQTNDTNTVSLTKPSDSGLIPMLMSRMQGDIELGYAIGPEYDYRTDFLKLNFTVLYNLNPFFSLGLGGGVRFYHDEKDTVIPLYTCFQANLPGNTVKPYFSLSFGYLLDITTDFTLYDVVPLFNPAAGICYNVSKNLAINIGIGYEMQKSEIFDDWLGTTYPKYLSFVSFNAGFSFRHLNFMSRGK